MRATIDDDGRCGSAPRPTRLGRRRIGVGRKLGTTLSAAFLTVTAGAASPTLAQTAEPAEGRILSAFFSLDDSRRILIASLPMRRLDAGQDGMPVIFSHEIDESTLDPDDLKITRASGGIARVTCVKLRSADEPGERRTVLVIGNYGSAADQPVRVEIVGELTSLDRTVTMTGASADPATAPATGS